MQANGQDWILIGSFSSRNAFEQSFYLNEIGIKSTRGPAFDWRASIASKTLVAITEVVDGKEVVGIYVEPSNFDTFIDNSLRASSPLDVE